MTRRSQPLPSLRELEANASVSLSRPARGGAGQRASRRRSGLARAARGPCGAAVRPLQGPESHRLFSEDGLKIQLINNTRESLPDTRRRRALSGTRPDRPAAHDPARRRPRARRSRLLRVFVESTRESFALAATVSPASCLRAREQHVPCTTGAPVEHLLPRAAVLSACSPPLPHCPIIMRVSTTRKHSARAP